MLHAAILARRARRRCWSGTADRAPPGSSRRDAVARGSSGAPTRSRTWDLAVRSGALCPAELWGPGRAVVLRGCRKMTSPMFPMPFPWCAKRESRPGRFPDGRLPGPDLSTGHGGEHGLPGRRRRVFVMSAPRLGVRPSCRPARVSSNYISRAFFESRGGLVPVNPRPTPDRAPGEAPAAPDAQAVARQPSSARRPVIGASTRSIQAAWSPSGDRRMTVSTPRSA